jgi:hypothetical protein
LYICSPCLARSLLIAWSDRAMVRELDRPVANPRADAERRRRGRNWAILIVLLGLCGLFYAITIVKMAHL